MATHELLGNPWSIGTRNCRQPLQWPISSIMQIRLKIRMNTDAIFRNCQQQRQRFILVPASAAGNVVHTSVTKKLLCFYPKLRLRSVQQISECCTKKKNASNINSLNTLSKEKKKENKKQNYR